MPPDPKDETRAITPLIGVTGPDRGGLAAWWMTKLAVHRAGGRALRITPSRPRDIDQVDGLVIGGGADVAGGAPSVEEPLPEARTPLLRRLLGILLAPLLVTLRLLLSRLWQPRDPEDEKRDELELRLLGEAARRNLPVLGICRGAQLMNLAEGGTLLWNLSSFYTERPDLRTALPRRDVVLEPHSHLAQTLGVEHARVNSLHSHAVDRPGRLLRIVAREPSGVNQAIEHPRRSFWIGVQWHPEYLPQVPIQQRLFRRLVERAGAG